MPQTGRILLVRPGYRFGAFTLDLLQLLVRGDRLPGGQDCLCGPLVQTGVLQLRT